MPFTTPSSLLSRSRSSLSLPSPGFLGFRGALPGAGKTHSMCALLQLVHGYSLSHFTLRFRQVTHDLGFKARPCSSISGLGGRPLWFGALVRVAGSSFNVGIGASLGPSVDGGRWGRKSEGAYFEIGLAGRSSLGWSLLESMFPGVASAAIVTESLALSVLTQSHVFHASSHRLDCDFTKPFLSNTSFAAYPVSNASRTRLACMQPNGRISYQMIILHLYSLSDYRLVAG